MSYYKTCFKYHNRHLRTNVHLLLDKEINIHFRWHYDDAQESFIPMVNKHFLFDRYWKKNDLMLIRKNCLATNKCFWVVSKSSNMFCLLLPWIRRIYYIHVIGLGQHLHREICNEERKIFFSVTFLLSLCHHVKNHPSWS